MDIGVVAKKTGLAPSTLRYYEKFGLIQSNGRNGIRRTFPETVIQKLQLITLLKNNSFSLQEIKAMTERDTVDRQFLLHKTAELEQKITELTSICNALQYIVNVPEQHHYDCSTFQSLLNNEVENV